MGRKLYLLTILLVFDSFVNSLAWGWTSFKGHTGWSEARPYQSSNPTVELKTTRAIDQQQAEECYLFAFTGALEIANRNAWNRPLSPDLSSEYMFIQKLLAWSKEVLTNNSTLDDSFYFLDGGDVHHAMKLGVEYGLLPQQFFKPKVKFETWNLEALYKDLKEIVKEGRKKLNGVQDQTVRDKIVQVVLKKVQSRIAVEAGTQPEQFKWNGKNWSVHEFENEYGIKRNSHIFLLYPEGKWDMEDPWDLRKVVIEMVETFKGAFNYRKSSWNKIWHYLTGSIDQGLPALLSIKWGRSYHVLNVVGYEYNNKNEIVSFKLKNSWGDGYGDKGHAYFDLEDIQKNATSVWGFDAP